jgi:hypothetical protein
MIDEYIELDENLPFKYIFYRSGKCLSVDREIKWSNGYTRIIKGKVLRCEATCGYPSYSFSIGRGYQRAIPIHLLIARYFIPNPNPSLYKYVNHIDRNKLNYHITNLEWCTQPENIKHGKSKESYSIRSRYKQISYSEHVCVD